MLLGNLAITISFFIVSHRGLHISNVAAKIQSECVLPIGYLGQCTDNVIASGVGIRSAVWLKPAQDIPEFCWNFDFGRLPRLGPMQAAYRDRTVLDVQQRLGNASIVFLGMLLGSFELSTTFKIFLFGLSIELTDFSKIARIEKRLTTDIQFLDTFPCPIEHFDCASEIAG